MLQKLMPEGPGSEHRPGRPHQGPRHRGWPNSSVTRRKLPVSIPALPNLDYRAINPSPCTQAPTQEKSGWQYSEIMPSEKKQRTSLGLLPVQTAGPARPCREEVPPHRKSPPHEGPDHEWKVGGTLPWRSSDAPDSSPLCPPPLPMR